jgi:hypothetical protein
MSSAESKRRGRPRMDLAQRKRANLTFRVRDELRARLEAAARVGQRSISEEIEHRLEASFRDEELLITNLGGTAGQRIIRPLLIFFEFLALSGKDWTKDKETAGSLSDAIKIVVDAVVSGWKPPRRSKGEIEAIRSRQKTGAYQEAFAVLDLFGAKLSRT